ncbi:MAG: ribosome small subunit-dependent GTPase A, partial [Pirellulales bacterium]
SKKKIRTDFRKNRVVRTRETDWTRRDESAEDQSVHGERISGKGELTRRRTVVGSETDDPASGLGVLRDVDKSKCLEGRVLEVGGLTSLVRTHDGTVYQCATRRILKTLATDQRHVVVAGDVVWIQAERPSDGVIERVEPRRGVISRTSRGRQHVMVANVDQIVIVGSAAEPRLKPNLIDRLLLVAEQAKIRPVICINKIDLVDAASLIPLVGVYAQMGYSVLSVSALTGFGMDRLRAAIFGRTSVVAGQSGVGKSSLLNAVESGLALRIAAVSEETEKGRHTTSTARMIPLAAGGYVIDTPGVRQFQLWDVIPEEVAGFYRDLRPYANLCRFPDCTHTHEAGCAVKDAVADGQLDARRYESYCHLRSGDV